MQKSHEDLLAKLIRITTVHPTFIVRLRDEANQSDKFVDELLVQCEHRIQNQPNQCPAALTKAIEEDSRLKSLLLEAPAFQNFEGTVVRALTSIADVRPDENGSISTDDPIMQYVLEAVRNQADTTTVERLHLDYYLRITKLRHFESLVRWLRAYAPNPQYVARVQELDEWLDALSKGAGTAAPPQNMPKDVVSALVEQAKTSEIGVLRAAPRLAQVPQEHILALATDAFDESDPSGGVFSAESVVDARVARRALQEARKASALIDTPVKVRLELAHEIVHRRKFAKIQVLELAWPEVYSRVCASGGHQRLKTMEQSVLQPDLDLRLPSFWQELRASENLESFLRIPPYFAEIYAPELTKDLQETQPIVTSGAKPEGMEIPAEFERLDYTTISLTASGAYHLDDPGFQEVHMEMHRGEEEAREAKASLPYSLILEAASRLSLASARPLSRDLAVASAGPDDLSTPAAIGRTLWEHLFERSKLAGPVSAELKQDLPLRLVVECTGDTGLIPWECLSVAGPRVLDARSRRFSLVRKSGTEQSAVRVIRGELRILVVHAVPDEVPLPSADQEIDVLERTFSSATASGAAKVEILRMATVERLQQRLRTFRPHIFHFIGHGVVNQDGGNLVLVGDDGHPQFLAAPDVGVMLQDEHILLAVLNACDAGSGGGTGESVAAVLSEIGLPAAIAPTRLIRDDAALWFSRAFYSALIDGLSVEGALSESRKALSLQGWDWSAYALYAPEGLPLASLRIVPSRSAVNLPERRE